MPPLQDIVGFLVSKDAFAIVGGICFAVAFLLTRTQLASQYFKTPRSQTYLSLAVAVLPGLGLALTHHLQTGTSPDVATILQLAAVGVFAALNPAKPAPSEPAASTDAPKETSSADE